MNIFRGSSVGRAASCEKLVLLFMVYLFVYTVSIKKKDKRIYADRAEYLRKAVSKRRKKLREMAREYKGSKCQICGYKKSQRALSFHHINPKEKDFGLSVKGLTRSWEKIKQEIDKCILICANCHMEVHDGITQLPKRNLGRKRR